jgi:membrane-associated protein
MAALYPDDLGLVPLLVLLSIAAILGDTINYFLGRWIGPRAFSLNTWFLKHEHLEKTQAFYDRHGGKTIVLARFVPIVRTFAPFVAGVGKMHYPTFLWFNVFGGLLWVGLCTVAGYFFGNIEAVKKHFELVVIGIVLVSVLPLAWEWWAARQRSHTR